MIPCGFFTGHKATAVLLVLRMKLPINHTLRGVIRQIRAIRVQNQTPRIKNYPSVVREDEHESHR